MKKNVGEFESKPHLLETGENIGGVLGLSLSMITLVLVLAGSYFLLIKRRDFTSFYLLTASLAVLSYAFGHYQYSLMNWGALVGTQSVYPERNFDVYLVNRGGAIRFSIIGFGLIVATSVRACSRKVATDHSICDGLSHGGSEVGNDREGEGAEDGGSP